MDLASTMRDRIRARSTGSRWYDIRNAADPDTAVIRVYGEISSWWGGISAEDFARDLALVTAGHIEVQINSPGGEVFDGVAIYNALRAHSARITTRVDGLAASVASVIAQAGDTRVMLSGSQMMVHEAWGCACGPAAEMRAYADLLERQNANIANIYASRAGGTAQEYLDLMAQGDTWLTAEEAVERGLADEVVDPPSKGEAKAQQAAKVSLEKPAKAPPPAAKAQLAAAVEQAGQELDQALAILRGTQTSPAGEREEMTAADLAAVTSEEAQRLVASLTLMKEA